MSGEMLQAPDLSSLLISMAIPSSILRWPIGTGKASQSSLVMAMARSKQNNGPEVGTRPVTVHASDINSDGIPDLAVVNERSNDISILIGLGDGTFPAKPIVDTGRQPFAVAEYGSQW